MVSEETRKKIGDAHRGKRVPEDTRKKLSKANTKTKTFSGNPQENE